ncbi:MAG: DUF2397 family protein [Lachnospiraceae bacterium]|nr:DUF2397 family protein [Lachnospiraceae bacterium]
MKIHDKLVKPVWEAKCLDVENTDRYRSIVRLFYLNYEKLKYWMYQEEVYKELTEDAYFADYTMEQCQQERSHPSRHCATSDDGSMPCDGDRAEAFGDGMLQLRLHWAYFLGDIPTALVKALKKLL